MMSYNTDKNAMVMNWEDTKFLLALSKEGTLRKAAMSLHVDQATVSRRIATLEQSLGCTLFIRSPRGFSLTPEGFEAVSDAKKIEVAANSLIKNIKNHDNNHSGEVIITTTDSLAIDYLLKAIDALKQKTPHIQVTLDISSSYRDMMKREADIAIRTQRPSAPNLVVKRLLNSEVRIYASTTYLERRGYPENQGGLLGHDIVMHPNHAAKLSNTLMGFRIENASVSLLSQSSLVLREAIKCGLGLGILPRFMAEKDNLVPIWPNVDAIESYEIWLVTHSDSLKKTRIKAVIKEIEKVFIDN